MTPLRLLYAVQGTGNGHVARAQALVPLLLAQPNVRLDLVVSGTLVDVGLPLTPRERYAGFSFRYGKSGGIDWFQTFWANSWWKLLRSIQKTPVAEYDLVLNDFEPVTAYACKWRKIPIIDISHQAGVRHPGAARPKHQDPLAEWVLANFAPAKRCLGFHFVAQDINYRTPVIRPTVRQLKRAVDGSVLVYLPAYAPEVLLPVLMGLSQRVWHVFVRPGTPLPKNTPEHVNWHAIDQEAFLDRLSRASHVLCSAGFELPAEALFLGAALAIVPIAGQYEQSCNAAEAKKLGARVLCSLHRPKDRQKLTDWLGLERGHPVYFPDETETLVQDLLRRFRENPQLPDYVRAKS